MIAALALFLVIAIAAAFAFLLLELRDAKREKKIAEDRLYAAWKEGALIPPRPEPADSAPEEPPTPIPVELRDLVDRWEDDFARTKAEQELRHFLDEGWSEARIRRHYEELATS